MSAVYREWVNHYLREGADHIYLIDNNSTDNCGLPISDFVEKGLVTLIWDPTRHFQVKLLGHILERARSRFKARTACALLSCTLHVMLQSLHRCQHTDMTASMSTVQRAAPRLLATSRCGASAAEWPV